MTCSRIYRFQGLVLQIRSMFIHSIDTVKFLVVIPFALIFCIMQVLYSGWDKKVLFFKNSIHLIIAILLVGGLLVWNDFYHYAHIGKQEIVTRQGLLTKETRHELRRNPVCHCRLQVGI